MRTWDDGSRHGFAAWQCGPPTARARNPASGRPTPFGTYVEAVQTGGLLFLSGMLPVVDHKPKYLGRLGKELDTEAGRDAAYTAALSALAAADSIWVRSIA